ncbi:carbohydrate-binding protein [Gemmata sp.]|uniref:carbohydrate-binding protein n=1 Tax=Gemmata sp. TaxID=1914242 RepID=UPI003F6F573F
MASRGTRAWWRRWSNPSPVAAPPRRWSCLTVTQLEDREVPASLYVAPSGSNAPANTGQDVNNPLQTIQRAADLAQPGDTVYVKAGTYRETVTPANSGTSSAGITYRPFNNDVVTIDGTDALTSWTSVGGAVYRASMPWNYTSNSQSNQVFAGDQMLNLARWPTETSNDLIRDPYEATIDAAAVDGSGNLVITDAEFGREAAARWVGAKVWVNLSHNGHDGQGQTGTVVSAAGNTITVSGIDTRGVTSGNPNQPWGVGPGTRYYLFDPTAAALGNSGGVAAGIDPGEWWYDSANSQLYVHLPDDSAPASADGTPTTVEAKRRSFGFDLSGKSYVTVQGFNLFGTSLTTDNQGDRRTNNGTYGGNVAPAHHLTIAGITAKYVTHFTDLAGNYQMQWLQQSGLQISGSHITLRDSTIQYSAGSGVSVFGRNNTVTNNVIYDVNYQATEAGALNTGRTYAPGLVTSWDHDISYNTIYNSPQQGINFRALVNSANSRTNSLARIHHNVIHDVMLRTFDSGAIDQFGSDGQWVRIDHNVIYNIPGSTNMGIYVDFGKRYVIDHNTVYNVRNPIEINWTNADQNQDVDIFNNVGLSDLPTGRGINNGFGGVNPGNRVRNNVVTAGVGGHTSGATVSNNLTATIHDALFTNPRQADYSLAAGASAAINQGADVSPYNDPLSGAPDIGAFERGTTAWTAGSSLAGTAPAVPTGLSVTPVSSSQNNLAWTDNAATEKSYTVLRSADGGLFWQEVVRLPANTTAYVDTDLRGLQYQYRVRADRSTYSNTATGGIRLAGQTFFPGLYDAQSGTLVAYGAGNGALGGTSPGSWARYNQIDFGASGSVTSVTANFTSGSAGSTITVRLDSVTGPVAATITSANGTWQPQTRTAAVSGASGVRDVFLVFSGWGTANMSSFAFGPAAAFPADRPAAPSNFAATAPSVGQVNLSWTNPTSGFGPDGTKVERSTDGRTWVQIARVSGAATSYSDTTVAAGTRYLYRVRGANRFGDSAYSRFRAVTAPAAASVDLTAAFNRVGIVTDGTRFSGGLDGVGYALSANLLGQTVAWGGAAFALGAADRNNVVSATGQTVALPGGTFSALRVLATGVMGNQSNQAFVVRYTDGTSRTFTQSVSDWYRPQNYAGESRAVSMPYRNTAAGGKDQRAFYVYGYSFALDAGKTVQSVTLPRNSNVEVLAMTLV